jgi:hypothetical protein
MASVPVGPLGPVAAALRKDLPPALIEALEGIGNQIEVEILDPLLSAASIEQLAETFERVFPKFRDYYISTILIVLGWLREDPQRFSALTMRSFLGAERLIRSHGQRWIAQDASLSALHGLRTMSRVAKAATAVAAKQPDFPPHDPNPEVWANTLVAYAMAFSAAITCLAALADGRNSSAKLENVAALAHWSKGYAVRAYHFAKVAGLVKTMRPSAPVGRSDEEDLVLAEAGLDSYLEGIAQEDRP